MNFFDFAARPHKTARRYTTSQSPVLHKKKKKVGVFNH